MGEKNNKEDNYTGPDLTKDAFFSDMEDIEEEIASEAYSTVEHGLSLIESRFFDDAIEVLRQAIGLYEQINRDAEINAIKTKIADVYILKEQEFRRIESSEISDATKEILEIVPSEDSTELYDKISNLLQNANQLIQTYQFDKALDEYDQAMAISQNLNDAVKIEGINKLIEECYNKKAEYLREKRKEAEMKAVEHNEEVEIKPTPEEVKIQKLKEFEEAKQREEDLSNEAFEKIGKASDLAKIHQYDEAIKLYLEGAALFDQIRWDNESQKIHDTISYLEKEKENHLKAIERIKAQEQERATLEQQRETKLSENVVVQQTEINEAQRKEIAELNAKKQKDEQFQKEISGMIDQAEKLARQYDIDMKKAIKRGELIEKCIYPRVIQIYEEIRNKVDERGWKDQVAIYRTQIKKYKDLLEKDNRIREIEEEKTRKQKEYEELHRMKKPEIIDSSKLKDSLDQHKMEEGESSEIKNQIEFMANKAEQMGRNYESQFKKAIKKGDLTLDSKYPNVINIYSKIINIAKERGLNEEIAIYSTQIRKYKDLLEKENKVREIERQKSEERRKFDESRKIRVEKTLDPSKAQELEQKQIKELNDQAFQEEITFQVNKAEKLAREYEVGLKKAIKEGKLLEKSPFDEIIDIYINVRNRLLSKGWEHQAGIYTNQIKIYQEKLDSDKKLRETELEKRKKQEEYEQFKRLDLEKELGKEVISKITQTQIKSEQQVLDSKFEDEIDSMVNNAEKIAREYEIGIKKGEFDLQCPYPQIIEIYDEIRKKVYTRGWQGEAEVYSNQIRIYREKLQNDIKLRELEEEKQKKQLLYEESMKASPTTDSKFIRLKTKEEEQDENDLIFNQAMDIINKTENEVKSYELSLKKEILTISSPYPMAIENYEKARKLLMQIGWKEEALKLNDTISLYKQKKMRDDNLRNIEMEKLKKDAIKSQISKKVETNKVFAEEEKRIELEKLKQEKSKEADFVFELINRAESMAQEYELKKKEDILSLKSPYQEIINTYKVAQEKFKEIGWLEQSSQLVNTISHYKEKMDADQRLRYLEYERIRKEQEELEKLKHESKLAREAEEELKKQKAKALEIKRKQQLEYEAKKDQAFNFMDLAKKELAQNNFEKAINFYKESEKIFAEINWAEGIRMINESVGIIKRKKEKHEQEQRYLLEREQERKRLESEIKQQITKAQDLKKMQEEQRRQEFLELQKEKEREKEVAEQAYKLLEEGTKLKDKKKFEEAYEKYIMGRDLFTKLDWQHEVSRINNDLLFILKKEMKQVEKIKAIQEKKEEEQKELEVLLKQADLKQQEMEKIKKEEKRKQREKIIEEEMENANLVIKDLKYNEAILKLKRVIRKLEKIGNKKLVKQIENKINILENASQIPLIATEDIEKSEYRDQYKLALKALDKAQLSLSKNLFMRAISELNEVIYNLEETKLGDKYIPLLEEKIDVYKKELGIEDNIKLKEKEPVQISENDDLRVKIAERRAERRKKIRDLLEE